MPAFREGEIRVPAFPARADVGYFRDSNGAEGGRLELSGNHNIYLLGARTADSLTEERTYRSGEAHQNERGVVRISAGGRLAVDYAGGEVTRLQLESPRVGLLAVQGRWHATRETVGENGYVESRLPAPNPYLTAGLEGASVGYQHHRIDGLETRMNGVDFRFLSGDVHAATQANGRNLDLYASASGLARTGEVNGSGERLLWGAQATLGVGVDLGVVGNLRAEDSVLGLWAGNGDRVTGQTSEGRDILEERPYTALTRAAVTARLDRPANLPLSASATYSTEHAASGGDGSQERDYQQTIFAVGGAF
jgi:hypothetical protein